MKRTPGQWMPPVEKPEEIGVGDNALSRIANSLSPMAFQEAARKAAAMGLEYGNSGVIEEEGPAYQESQGGGGHVEANFDSIADDSLYRVARALYNAGQPEQSVELRDGVVAELYPDDLAILFIRGGRSMNHVDIRTARSVRQLDDMWSQIVD